MRRSPRTAVPASARRARPRSAGPDARPPLSSSSPSSACRIRPASAGGTRDTGFALLRARSAQPAPVGRRLQRSMPPAGLAGLVAGARAPRTQAQVVLQLLSPREPSGPRPATLSRLGRRRLCPGGARQHRRCGRDESSSCSPSTRQVGPPGVLGAIGVDAVPRRRPAGRRAPRRHSRRPPVRPSPRRGATRLPGAGPPTRRPTSSRS